MPNNKTATPTKTQVLPIMTWNQSASGNLTLATFSGKTVTIENSDAPDNAFVVEVPDNSLEPRFAKGTHLVAVKSKPSSGSMVLVYSHVTRKVSVCYYFKEKAQPMLVNVILSAPAPDDQDDIMGVLIEARWHVEATG